MCLRKVLQLETEFLWEFYTGIRQFLFHSQLKENLLFDLIGIEPVISL